MGGGGTRREYKSDNSAQKEKRRSTSDSFGVSSLETAGWVGSSFSLHKKTEERERVALASLAHSSTAVSLTVSLPTSPSLFIGVCECVQT